MTILSYRGDAPAVAKVCQISKPDGYVAGQINLKINNKTVSWFEWDVDALVEAWNNSEYSETRLATASSLAPEESDSAYGTTEPSLLLTASTPGIDFFVTVTIGDGSSTNEVQTILFDPEPNGGTFTLTFDGQTTAAITFVAGDPSATAANILAALNALSNIAPGDVTVAATSQYSYEVTFATTYAETNVPLMTIDFTNLLGGDVIASVTTIQDGVLPVDEVQTLSLPIIPTGGTFTLTYDGQTTGNIAYNANAATVQAALEALSNITAGDVVCSGGALPATPVVITFAQLLAGQNVPLITGDGSLLTGGTSNITGITTTRNGSVGQNCKHINGHIGTNPIETTQYYWRTFAASNAELDASAVFLGSASNADIKAALVGLTCRIDTPSGMQNYVITSDDIDVTGDLSIPFNTSSLTGGIQIEFKGAFAQMNIPISRNANAISMRQVDRNQEYNAVKQTATEAFEIQEFTVTDSTITGSYDLTVYDSAGSPHTITDIPYSTVGSSLASFINSALGGQYVSVDSTPSGSSYTHVINYQYLGYQIVDITQLTSTEGEVQVIETTGGDAGSSDQQLITAAGSEDIRAGTFTLTYDGQTTGAIAYNASAATIQAALEALSNLDSGDVVVSGGPLSTNDIILTFDPSLGDAVEISITSSLVNSEAVLSETITGGIAIFIEELIRNRGPECFDDELNYDPHAVPSENDDIVYEFGISACKWGTKQRDTFHVHNISTNTLQLTSGRWLFQDGQLLRVKSTGTAPSGLTAGQSYYIINSNGVGQFQLSSTFGGSAITIGDEGTGTHTIGLLLNSITKPARYSNDIGLPRTNGDFEEFRPRYLEVWVDDHVTLGERDGTDSGLQRFDFGDTAIANGIKILGTAAASENSAPAVGILIESATTNVKAYGGSVGLAPFLDETAEVQDIETYDTELSSVGGTTCRNITMDRDSTLIGNFTPSGSILIGQ